MTAQDGTQGDDGPDARDHYGDMNCNRSSTIVRITTEIKRASHPPKLGFFGSPTASDGGIISGPADNRNHLPAVLAGPDDFRCDLHLPGTRVVQ